jgi:hypothetical protein
MKMMEEWNDGKTLLRVNTLRLAIYLPTGRQAIHD